MSINVTLNATGVTYRLPERGEVDWNSGTSRYLKDLATVINGISSGSLVTPVYNVKNYGATGDGTTDDTVAVKAAMAALLTATGTGGGTLYFPAGSYKITSKLQFGVAAAQANIKLSGDGASSIVKQYGAFSTDPLIEFRNCNYWEVSDLAFDASGSSGTRDIILVDGSSYGRAERNSFTGAKRYAINITQVSGVSAPVGNVVDDNFYTGSVIANVFLKVGVAGSNSVNYFSGGRQGRDYVSIKEFGAVGDGVTDDTQAIQNAIDSVWHGASNLYGKTVFFPAGTYACGHLSISGKTGFHLVGEGKQATQLRWNGVAGTDFLYIQDSQLWSIEKMSIIGDPDAPPRAMIRSRATTAPVISPYGMTFSSLHIDGDADDAYTYGIWFDTDGAGGNSEAMYIDCNVFRAIEDCVRLEGSQAKCHNFYHTNLGVAKKGIHSFDPGGGIGATAPQLFSGGSFGSCTEAAIKLTYPGGEPCTIESVQSEHCYRFIDEGTTPTTSTQAISIRRSRLAMGDSTSPTPAFSSWFRFTGLGPYTIEGCTIEGGADGIPQVSLNNGNGWVLTYRNNYHSSTNAVATSPINNVTGYAGTLDMRGNWYLDSTGTIGYRRRLEPLDAAAPTGFELVNQSGDGEYMLQIPIALWTAAATSQTITLTNLLPKGTVIEKAAIYVHTAYVLPGGHTITFKLGTSSGGNELLLAGDVSTTAPVYYGAASGDLGATLAAPVQGGVMLSYTAASSLYLTANTSVENLGTGAATRMTAGTGFLYLKLKQDTRWLLNV